MKDLEGKAALVTGGGAGIGRATALALAAAGAAVVAADIDETAARETVRLIEEAGGRGAALGVDVTNPSDIDRMVAFTDETFRRLDVFHNNAGINTGWPRFPDVSRERWAKTVDVNLTAVIAGIQTVTPIMRRSGGGAIVNSASMAGLIAFDAEPIYARCRRPHPRPRLPHGRGEHPRELHLSHVRRHATAETPSSGDGAGRAKALGGRSRSHADALP
jgi:NAD(P)-dependent dehydrogenase (short-subunit alcohol dehydrogenase family)